jgi:hypothetical protein
VLRFLTNSSSIRSHRLNRSSTKDWMSDLLQDGDCITYPSLVDFRRHGLRNGNWRHLDTADRALFRCAFWVAKVRGKISNTKLMVQVLKIALKLVERAPSTILEAGRRRAAAIYEAYAKPSGVFSWAPQVRGWLNDVRYVWYLGVLGVNS